MRNLSALKNQSVLVVGDIMVDKYIFGTVERISPEAPVPVLLQSEVKCRLGGAGNVIANVTSLGAKVRALVRVGKDAGGEFVRESLRNLDVDDRYIVTSGRTIVKTRVAACNQQFIRIDEELIVTPSEQEIGQINQAIDTVLRDITVVIISDYAKGFVTEELSQVIIQAARARDIPVLVDPKGKDASKYRGATAVTPNSKEFLRSEEHTSELQSPS